MHYRSIFISDLHLGTKMSNASAVLDWLKHSDSDHDRRALRGELPPGKVVAREAQQDCDRRPSDNQRNGEACIWSHHSGSHRAKEVPRLGIRKYGILALRHDATIRW